MTSSKIPRAVIQAVNAGFHVCVVRNHKRIGIPCAPSDIQELNRLSINNPGCSWGILLGKQYDAIAVECKKTDRGKLNEHCIAKSGLGGGEHCEFYWKFTPILEHVAFIDILFRWRAHTPRFVMPGIKVIKTGYLKVDPDGYCSLSGDEPESFPNLMCLMTIADLDKHPSEKLKAQRLFFVEGIESKVLLGLETRNCSNAKREQPWPDDVLVFSPIKISSPDCDSETLAATKG